MVGPDTLNVYEKVWFKPMLSGTWTLAVTTPPHLVSGTGPSDVQFLIIPWFGPPDVFECAIEIYEVGAATPDYTRNSSNDIDLLGLLWEGVLEDSPPATITSITPGKSSAGTGNAVTIVGTNFGSLEGSGRVEFFFKTGESTIPGSVRSWSDSQIVCEVPTGSVILHDGHTYSGSAGSGPIRVSNQGHAPAAASDFMVSFGYGGQRWGGTNPLVPYYLGTALPAAYRGAIDAAASTWSRTRG